MSKTVLFLEGFRKRGFYYRRVVISCDHKSVTLRGLKYGGLVGKILKDPQFRPGKRWCDFPVP